MVAETDWYLPVHQAGFRKERGTRDNIFILAQIMDEMIEGGQDMVTVFIDYVAAFQCPPSLHLELLERGRSGSFSRSPRRAAQSHA
eukprot:COSAG01_NODE_920_length_12728_cov_38.396864_9_plen_86_part_00